MKKASWKFGVLVVPFLILAGLFLLLACSKSDKSGNDGEAEKGYVTGSVTDTKGNPLPGAALVIDNTLIYNSNLLTTSNNEGKYKVKLSGAFTWVATASFEKNYNGKKYTFKLHPETDEAFTSDGGVRNFSWKLSGQRPESASAFYGAYIQLQSTIGSVILAEDVDFTLTPSGPLVDGSNGVAITKRGGAPRTDAYFKLMDIPLGRYILTARYQGQDLQLKNLMTNESGKTLTLNFEPRIDLAGAYCSNCALIEYD